MLRISQKLNSDPVEGFCSTQSGCVGQLMPFGCISVVKALLPFHRACEIGWRHKRQKGPSHQRSRP